MIYLYENKNIDDKYKSLIDSIKNRPSLHAYFEINFKGIKPKNYCGFLSVDGESYFIIPKIVDEKNQNLNIFIYMLIYANNINLKNEDLMNADNSEHQIFEIFIRLFADELLYELKKGVFKRYITIQENLKVLRGKYIIEKNFNNFYHQNIYCEFDEFSMDNDLNRFFLYAIKRFKKFSSYGNLHRCEAVLNEVDYLNVDFKKLDMHFDRMSSRYKKSYEVAMMILKKLVPMTENSKDDSFAFLFNMAYIFEGFVGRLYMEMDSSTVLQKQGDFGSLCLKPDIYTNSKIIDVKYKSFDNSGLKRDDKYQMYVYGKNFDKDTMLLYPQHLAEIDKTLLLGDDEMVRVEMRSLDLSFDGGYEEFVSKMKNRMEIIRWKD